MYPASGVGANHERDRVFIVGYSKHIGRNGAEDGKSFNEGKTGNETGEKQTGEFERSSIKHAIMAHSVQLGRGGRTRESRQGRRGEFENRGWWSVEPDVGGGIDGFLLWMDRYIGRGMSYEESRRGTEVLRKLWSDNVSKALREASGGLDRLQQAQILFSFLREYEKGTNEARLLLEGKEASEIFLRGLRERETSRSSSHRSEEAKQRPGEHTDSMQQLPRFLAFSGEAHWAGNGWEDATPRVSHGIPRRVDRLRALGNAVVPAQAFQVFRVIREFL